MAFTKFPLATDDVFLDVNGAIKELVDAINERGEAVDESWTDLTLPADDDELLTVNYIGDMQSAIDGTLIPEFVDDTGPFKDAGDIGYGSEAAIGSGSYVVQERSALSPDDGIFITVTHDSELSQASWTRKYLDGSDVVQTTTGSMQEGDIVGAWLFNEMWTMLKAMTVSVIRNTYLDPDDTDYLLETEPDLCQFQGRSFEDVDNTGPNFYSDFYGVDLGYNLGTSITSASASITAYNALTWAAITAGPDFANIPPANHHHEFLYFAENEGAFPQFGQNCVMRYTYLGVRDTGATNTYYAEKFSSTCQIKVDAGDIPSHVSRTIRLYVLPMIPFDTTDSVDGFVEESSTFDDYSDGYTEKVPNLVSSSSSTSGDFLSSFVGSSSEPSGFPDAADITNDPDGGDDSQRVSEGYKLIPFGLVEWTFSNV